MRTNELKLTWHLSRGYGQALHSAQDQDLVSALATLADLLREKYSIEPLECIGVPVPGLPLNGSGPVRFYLSEWDYDRREDVACYCRLREYAAAHPEKCKIEQDTDAEWPAPGGKVICGRRVVYSILSEEQND